MTGVQKIDISSKEYPKLLKEIPDPPEQLYVKGSIEGGIFDNCVGVVGTRDMSEYGKKATSYIICGLYSHITVVSGFMYGIDYWAHYYALRFGLKTIAVLPCGVDIVHPSEHEDLYNKIVDGGGLVISEYALGYHPRKWTYVKRNRIVAGLSKAVVVVEAAENSGSIITAGFADEYKRKVFAVPSSILDVRSKGTNGLIKDYGVLIDSGYQINDYVGSKKSKHSSKYSSVVDELLNLINRSPASLDEISEQINSDTMILSNLITSMTIEGMIENRKGLYYAC